MLSRSRRTSPFISPATSVEVDELPTGREWLHEIKFDGYRIQGHKAGDRICLFNRDGKDCTRRYPRVVAALSALPAFSAILDAELVAMGEEREDFYRTRSRDAHQQLVCFDILLLEGEDLRQLAFTKRKAKLKWLIGKVPPPTILCYCQHFTNGRALYARAEKLKLEGVVSKKRDSTYRKGNWCGWKKLKTKAWREANADRPDVFAKNRS